MPDVLIATDSPGVYDEVRQVLRASDGPIRWARTGAAAVDACREQTPDLAILDSQMGSMGAFAVAFELHLDAGIGDNGAIPVLILLDRRADVFLARRADVEGWLIKPLDPIRLRKAVAALTAGGTYHDDSYKPTTVAPV